MGFSVILPVMESVTQDKNRDVKLLSLCLKYLLPMEVTSQTAGLEDQVMCNLSLCFCSSFFLVCLPMWFAYCNDLLLCILL